MRLTRNISNFITEAIILEKIYSLVKQYPFTLKDDENDYIRYSCILKTTELSYLHKELCDVTDFKIGRYYVDKIILPIKILYTKDNAVYFDFIRKISKVPYHHVAIGYLQLLLIECRLEIRSYKTSISDQLLDDIMDNTLIQNQLDNESKSYYLNVDKSINLYLSGTLKKIKLR